MNVSPMFECQACLRRCLQAVYAAPRPVTRLRYVARHQTPPLAQLRSLHSAVNESSPSDADLDLATLPNENPKRARFQSSNTGKELGQDTAASNQDEKGRGRAQTWNEAVGNPLKASLKSVEKSRRVTPEKRNVENREPKESHLRAELKYLKDPVKLASHVRHVLENDDQEKALALCRMSSRDIANTVSWNYLLDYQMTRGMTNAAMKIFNEMKKRAQKPDSHTFVILLNGLANHAHHPNALGKALSLYHNMKSPNAKFPPSIIHVNAVLKVCARANDMESLWDIASQLPETGPHSANSWTFTTILNYMRMNVLKEINDDPESEESLYRVEEVVMKGKQLWSVIIARWQEGGLLIDERLVCSMGRLLLAGSRPLDWDNVFSLVEQTMNIRRLEPRLGTLAREQSGAPKIRAPYTPEELKPPPSNSAIAAGDESPDSVFDPVDNKPPHDVQRNARGRYGQRSSLFAFALPGNETISLLMEACLKTVLKQAAMGYWDLLTGTNGFGITPDLANIHMRLRIHRQAGQSSEALAVIEDLPQHNMRPTGTTFWLAMASCQKDTRSDATAFDNARAVLDNMQRTLTSPNIMTIHMFLKLARRIDDPRLIAAALQRVHPSVINLRSLLNYGGHPVGTGRDQKDLTETYRKEALRLFKGLLNTYDYMLHPDRNIDLGSLWQTYLDRRLQLDLFMQRLVSKTDFSGKGEKPLKWSKLATSEDVNKPKIWRDAAGHKVRAAVLPEAPTREFQPGGAAAI